MSSRYTATAWRWTRAVQTTFKDIFVWRGCSTLVTFCSQCAVYKLYCKLYKLIYSLTHFVDIFVHVAFYHTEHLITCWCAVKKLISYSWIALPISACVFPCRTACMSSSWVKLLLARDSRPCMVGCTMVRALLCRFLMQIMCHRILLLPSAFFPCLQLILAVVHGKF